MAQEDRCPPALWQRLQNITCATPPISASEGQALSDRARGRHHAYPDSAGVDRMALECSGIDVVHAEPARRGRQALAGE
jgi:hypothetical protein